MKTWHILLSSVTAMLLSGCGGTSDNFTSSQAVGGYIILDTKGGNIPYPNDILFAPTETEPADGTVNIPFDPDSSDAGVKSALNTLDGFSTTAPITVSVSSDINSSTLPGNIHLYKVAATDSNATSPIPMVETITSELQFGQDYVATYSNGKIAILPLKPLESHSHYMVVMTNGIKNNVGESIAPDYTTSLLINNTPLFDNEGNPAIILDSDPETNIATLKILAGLQQLTQQMLAVANKDEGISASDVISIWSFTTQTIGDVAQAFADQNYSQAVLGLQDTNLTSKDILMAAGYDVNESMAGIAKVYAGTLSNLPYYLGIPTETDPTAPLYKSFEFEDGNNLPKVVSNVTIPVLATVPNSASGCTEPDDGWPVVIFQHGITQNRTNLLSISESFANICYAAVAIDLPLHGIDDNTSKLYMSNIERTFDVDYVTQDSECNTIAAQPDGKPDCSGTHYINLKSLLTARDNMRQSTSDFIALKNALGTADKVNFDASQVSFVGHSLGAMAPFGFLTHRKLDTVVLANPGGGIAELLNNSPRFGPIIEAGLAAEGITKGSPEYDSFMLATQTIIDDADPINYAEMTAANQKMLSFEVINDQVIPNSVETAPLSGTEPLLGLMEAKNISDYAIPALVTLETNNTATRFTDGTHSSFLTPDVPSVMTEMQSEMATFILYKGEKVNISDDSIIK
ncbi:hypothetical protein RZR97_01380 [Hydrogenimonas thermophila]|uniref:hypothetical protein n=1 Tax=Hydrogenimonas thermophila TaxID=223786 RepID=UPI002937289E|nr:hypothetical protein [Hydrogenimonas thermophila]WOE70236.1 hypothetical protein RZR91_01390 [Hydrogenimonas thermophila]WOE72753.1 hypothetical protein RZR97_01380 [Hydrogenimonas thermophila]